jgi:hypothetical protein
VHTWFAFGGRILAGEAARPFFSRVLRFGRRHAVFGALLLAGATIRGAAMLGYRGPMRTSDSTRYVTNAVHLAPGAVRPSGYSLMLWLLEPFHSLMVVVGVQYAMGLATGVVGYALLRRQRLPGWGASLAMAPVLMSSSAVQLEHFVLSDTLFGLLVTIAVAVMLWWRHPPGWWACAVTGLVLAAAALTRSEGMPLLIVFLLHAGARLTRWRAVAGGAALCLAFAVPVAAYAGWYDRVHGTFALTSSTGAFLYGGTAMFADCATARPPATQRQLCPKEPVSQRKEPNYYIFHGPLTTIPGGPFGTRADRAGRGFALWAIRAQPLDYLRAVAGSFWEDFLPSPGIHPGTLLRRVWAQHQREYSFPAATAGPPSPLATRIFTSYDPAGPGLRIVSPYSGWARAYQRWVTVPGPLLGVIVLTGLGGLLVAWRRLGGDVALPWLTGLCLLAAPAAIVGSYPRYLVASLAPFCLAAALGIQQIMAAARTRPRS